MMRYLSFYLPYSLLYISVRTIKRLTEYLDFLPDSRLIIEVSMLLVVSLTFGLNWRLAYKELPNFSNYAAFNVFATIFFLLFWNLYAFLMQPHLQYIDIFDIHNTAYLFIGGISAGLAFIVLKYSFKAYEKNNYAH